MIDGVSGAPEHVEGPIGEPGSMAHGTEQLIGAHPTAARALHQRAASAEHAERERGEVAVSP